MEPSLRQLSSDGRLWQTAPCYQHDSLNIPLEQFKLVTDLLLENVNLNSTHLFRADILFDSTGALKTTQEKEQDLQVSHTQNPKDNRLEETIKDEASPKAPDVDGFRLERCVKRKLIPRNPQLDSPLVQTCYMYNSVEVDSAQVVVYLPHVKCEDQMPWYHPPLRMMAYLFEMPNQKEIDEYKTSPAFSHLSLHFLPFASTKEDIPERLHRTLLSLLNTFIRLSKSQSPAPDSVPRAAKPSDFKDTILPQHLVQDTYTCLKKKYASDLIARWVEKTEPSKHVFEDLSIAAFLIELWKQMYSLHSFPGFVDIACGNAVLVYVLLKEGYHGYGFDARRRKTWEILGIDDHLQEQICIPGPFLESLNLHRDTDLTNVNIHNGLFSRGTFIISNHADELTPWTPLLAALSCPDNPLPFLAIPCCSHALSGAKYRYPPKDGEKNEPSSNNASEREPQPANGDLKSLRTSKQKAAIHRDDKSTYACLTKKVVAIAQEIGFETELTLMRIPSTRNLGIVGNRKRIKLLNREIGNDEQSPKLKRAEAGSVENVAHKIVEQECRKSGGVDLAARIWLKRIQELQNGKGRGKVNLGGKSERG